MSEQSNGGGSAPNRPDAVQSASSSPQRTSDRRKTTPKANDVDLDAITHTLNGSKARHKTQSYGNTSSMSGQF